MTPYASTKAALASASAIARPLDLPASAYEQRVQASPDGDAMDRPIAVRAVLVRCSIDPEGEDAALLYRWATTTDARDEHDDAAETASSDGEYREAMARGQAVRVRLAALLEVVGPALVEARVVRRAPKPQLHRVGWRVHVYPGGRRETVIVLDPSLADPTIYTSLEAATAVQSGNMTGPTVEATLISSSRRHPELAARLQPAWERGDYQTLAELDEAVAELLGCRPRWARIVRASWGIHGSRGCRPTVPPT